jgi:hypothetical protein
MPGFMKMKGLAAILGVGTTKAGNTGDALVSMKYVDVFKNPLAAAVDTIVAAVASSHANLALLVTTLDFPRNLTITSDGAQTQAVLVTGTDQFDNVQTETITFAGAATIVGTKVFKTLVTVHCETPAPAGANVSVGIGSILGSSRKMNGLCIDGAVYTTASGFATAVQETTRPVKGATADVHGVTFNTALDPAKTHVLSYRSSEVR